MAGAGFSEAEVTTEIRARKVKITRGEKDALLAIPLLKSWASFKGSLDENTIIIAETGQSEVVSSISDEQKKAVAFYQAEVDAAQQREQQAILIQQQQQNARQATSDIRNDRIKAIKAELLTTARAIDKILSKNRRKSDGTITPMTSGERQDLLELAAKKGFLEAELTKWEKEGK